MTQLQSFKGYNPCKHALHDIAKVSPFTMQLFQFLRASQFEFAFPHCSVLSRPQDASFAGLVSSCSPLVGRRDLVFLTVAQLPCYRLILTHKCPSLSSTPYETWIAAAYSDVLVSEIREFLSPLLPVFLQINQFSFL
jgi:hypothetical protein